MLVFLVPYKSPIPSKLTGLFLHLPLTTNSHVLYVLYYLALLLAFGYFMVFHFPNMTALTFPSLDPETHSGCRLSKKESMYKDNISLVNRHNMDALCHQMTLN